MARAMKDSGIAWIGEIPEEWRIGKTSLFFDIQLGKMLQPEASSAEDSYENYLCAANLGGNALKMNLLRQMWFSVNDKKQFAVKKGDLLVVEGGDVASCDIIREEVNDLYIQNALHRVRSKNGYSVEYLRYILMIAKASGHIELICNKATIAHFTKDKFGSLPFIVSSVLEQSRIAAFLDRRCAEIDRVIAATQSTIEEYMKLKQSIITEAVTRGVRGPRKMKDSGVEWIGEIPVEWKIYRIANLYDERNESGQEDIPILTISINTGISDHEVEDEEQLRIFVRSEDRTKYKRVYPGDLAYNMMRAWQGAFGAVRVDGMVSPAYIVAKPKKNIILDSRYMEALLRTSSAIAEMHRYSHGITDFRLRLYWPEFKNIKVCIPPSSEQDEIANYLDMKNNELDHLIESKQRLLTELESYKKSVIYEYVTGKKEAPQ